MITTKLGELVNAEFALENLITQKLPIKTAYHISKLFRLVKIEIGHFNEQRNLIIKDLGTKDNDLWKVEPNGPNWTEFLEKINELVALEVNLDWKPINFDDLESITITPADLNALGSLIMNGEIKS